jgi:hypothetical protein
LFNPKVFFKISTLLLPKVNFKSTSGTTLPVFPSNTISLGAEVYPLPNEDIPIDSKDERGSTSITCGIAALGLIVKSDGKSNPISLIFTDLILPIEVLESFNIAPVPIPDVETPNVEIPVTFKI